MAGGLLEASKEACIAGFGVSLPEYLGLEGRDHSEPPSLLYVVIRSPSVSKKLDGSVFMKAFLSFLLAS